MRRSIPLFVAMLLFTAGPPLIAQCGCETGPCEEVTLQSVAEEDPSVSGFGSQLAPVRVVRHGGMTIDLSSADSNDAGAAGTLLVFAALMVPVISGIRRRLGGVGPLIALDLSNSACHQPDETTATREVHCGDSVCVHTGGKGRKHRHFAFVEA